MKKWIIWPILGATSIIVIVISWIIYCAKNGLLIEQTPKSQPTIQVKEVQTEEEFKQADPEACVAKFEEEAKETLDLYDGIKYSVNKWTVAVVIDLDKWNATSEEDRNAFMNEIYALLSVDARSSGILSDHAVSISFMTSDYKNTKVFKVEKE